MRRAEIITAGILALFSVYLMWKSTELDIGYIKGEGPGGGAWPFWLSAVMLICTGFIALNWVRRTSPPSQSDDVFLDGYGKKMLLLVGGGITGFIALINIISMYGAMFVFLIYYLRILGRHTWAMDHDDCDAHSGQFLLFLRSTHAHHFAEGHEVSRTRFQRTEHNHLLIAHASCGCRQRGT